MIEAFVYSKLANDATITALVSDRIFPTIPSQDTDLPFIVYRKSGSEPVFHLQGKSDLTRHEITVEYWAVNFDDLASLGEAIRNSLDGYRGTEASASVTVQGCFLKEQSSEVEEEGYHASQIYWLWS